VRVLSIAIGVFDINLKANVIEPIEAKLEAPFPGEATYLQIAFSIKNPIPSATLMV
jgi:hypothetical protein